MKEIVWSQVFKSTSHKRLINSFKVLASLGLSSITRTCFCWGVPLIFTVEPTVRCNLNCPQCLTGRGRIYREQSSLNLDLFKQIITEIGDKIWYLLLYNQGEPFQHQNLIDLIEVAKRKGIYVVTSTNGHFLTKNDFVERLVKSGLDTIMISLDGVDPDTYVTYRQGGDFHQVIDGINRLVNIRNKNKSKTPKIFIQCLVMRHNEHQLHEMKQLAQNLKIDRLLFKTFQLGSKEDGQDFLPTNPKWRRYLIKNGDLNIKSSKKRGCSRLWYSTVLLSDGRIVPCCFDKNGKYSPGNMKDNTSINQIWKSDAYNKFRITILQERKTVDICQNCTQNQTIYL